MISNSPQTQSDKAVTPDLTPQEIYDLRAKVELLQTIIAPHDPETVLAAVADIAVGKGGSAWLSHLPVVIVGKQHYDDLLSDFEDLRAENEELRTGNGPIPAKSNHGLAHAGEPASPAAMDSSIEQGAEHALADNQTTCLGRPITLAMMNNAISREVTLEEALGTVAQELNEALFGIQEAPQGSPLALLRAVKGIEAALLIIRRANPNWPLYRETTELIEAPGPATTRSA